jgi:hypothetical protein
LADAANNLTGTDLLLVANTITDDDLAPAWFYLPRMLHAGSLVLERGACKAKNKQRLSAYRCRTFNRVQPSASARRRSVLSEAQCLSKNGTGRRMPYVAVLPKGSADRLRSRPPEAADTSNNHLTFAGEPPKMGRTEQACPA